MHDVEHYRRNIFGCKDLIIANNDCFPLRSLVNVHLSNGSTMTGKISTIEEFHMIIENCHIDGTCKNSTSKVEYFDCNLIEHSVGLSVYNE